MNKSKTKKLALSGAILIVVLVVIGYFYFFKNNNIQDVAISKVTALPEVQEYLKIVPNANIDVQTQEDGTYLIHVYEIKDRHTATFNWYSYDAKTQELKNFMTQ